MCFVSPGPELSMGFAQGGDHGCGRGLELCNWAGKCKVRWEAAQRQSLPLQGEAFCGARLGPSDQHSPLPPSAVQCSDVNLHKSPQSSFAVPLKKDHYAETAAQVIADKSCTS